MSAGEKATLTVEWNVYERTTFRVKVVSLRAAAMGQQLLGLSFVDLDVKQKHDLSKQLHGVTSSLDGLREVS